MILDKGFPIVDSRQRSCLEFSIKNASIDPPAKQGDLYNGFFVVKTYSPRKARGVCFFDKK